jgi:peptidoglycan hydrolase-like protein with peptidoglycan-binding domain
MSIASHRRLRLVLSAVLLLVLALSLGRAGVAAGAPVRPPTPPNLPSAIETLAGYVPQVSCDPTTKPGAARLGRLLTTTYPKTSYGTARSCGTSPSSEHHDGRAVDWMVSVRTPERKAEAEAVLGWLLAPDSARNEYAIARRLGVMYLIWNNRIWSAYRAEEGWRPYSDCADHPEKSADSRCHRNHIHFSLSWEGARGVTSYWTGRVARADYGPCRPPDLNWAAPYSAFNPNPCPRYPAVSPPPGASSTLRTLVTYSGQILREGSTGVAVKAVQKVVGVTTTGTFGPGTERALKRWQTGQGLSASGVVGVATWRALLRSQAP